MGIDERRYPMLDEGWTTAFEYLYNLEDIGKDKADAVFKHDAVVQDWSPHPQIPARISR